MEITRSFESQWNFPNHLGTMDGKHIVVKQPRSSFLSFSLVLLGIIDANYKFIHVDVESITD